MPHLPERTTQILGVSVPELDFDPFVAPAPAKLRVMVSNLGKLFYP